MSDFPVTETQRGDSRTGFFSRPDRVEDKLHVICVLFNPHRYRSRWALYEKFEKFVQASGAELWTVEGAFGDRQFTIDRAGDPHYIQVRTSSELWLKENLANIGASCLPRNWRYMALMDADITLVRPDWVGETLHQLQHYAVVQMFSEAYDMTEKYEIVQKHLGFGYCYVHNVQPPQAAGGSYYYPPVKEKGVYLYHPGWAWAWRRDAFDAVGGFMDHCITGAADNHMAHSLIGRGRFSAHPSVHPNYMRLILEWQRRAERDIQRNIGYVQGALHHQWHGPKASRRYWDRWKVIVHNQYDPMSDIRRNWDNLWQLNVHDRRTQKLRDDLRGYFRQRDEDQLHVEP